MLPNFFLSFPTSWCEIFVSRERHFLRLSYSELVWTLKFEMKKKVGKRTKGKPRGKRTNEAESDIVRLHGDGAVRLDAFVDINSSHFHLLIVMVLNRFRWPAAPSRPLTLTSAPITPRPIMMDVIISISPSERHHHHRRRRIYFSASNPFSHNWPSFLS